jgi:hypothetical protein
MVYGANAAAGGNRDGAAAPHYSRKTVTWHYLLLGIAIGDTGVTLPGIADQDRGHYAVADVSAEEGSRQPFTEPRSFLNAVS